jgi:hypothetical protein
MHGLLQGNCTSPPPAPTATAPAVPQLKRRQCILYPGIFRPASGDASSGAPSGDTFITFSIAFQNTSILLDNLALAAPEKAPGSGGGGAALTLLTMASALGDASDQTIAHVYLRSVILQGGRTDASDAAAATSNLSDAATWQGVMMDQQWRLFAEGALLQAFDVQLRAMPLHVC